MYKLVCIGGILRGKEYSLENSVCVLGRSSQCDIVLDSLSGVSKKHAQLTISTQGVFLEDLKSSNGTFVNGKLVSRKELKPGDQFAIPNAIFQLVKLQEKIKIIKKAQQISTEAEFSLEKAFEEKLPESANVAGKLLFFFRQKFMPLIYGINKEYEWHVLFAILFSLYVVLTISSTIVPVLKTSNSILTQELAKRGIHFAEEVARINARALERKDLDALDTFFIEKETDVTSYELFDLEGRIVRPLAKINEHTNDPFSVQARDWIKNQGNKSEAPFIKSLGVGKFGIAQKVMAYNPRTGNNEIVGIIALKFAPPSLVSEGTRNLNSWLEALSVSAIITILFYGIFYYLTLRPLQETTLQIEALQRGKLKTFQPTYLMQELHPLREKIQSILIRLRDLEQQASGEAAEFNEVEEDAPYVEKLSHFLMGVGSAGIILNSQKQIEKINSLAEDATGMRESACQGQDIIDSTREKGLSATLIELCDSCANSQGVCQEGEYELQGNPHKIYVNGLIGKDNFLKAYLITFVRE